MSNQPKKPKDKKPMLFEIPLDVTDEELKALAKAMRVAYFGYDPQESPDFVPSEKDYFGNFRSGNTNS